VHESEDVIKLLMVGASVTMLCSALLQRSIDHIRTLEREIRHWMETHEYTSVQQMRGSMSQQNVAEASAFERAHYVSSLRSYKPGYYSRSPDEGARASIERDF
jgi:dihydroorotate dehydrogenase (fumarate)